MTPSVVVLGLPKAGKSSFIAAVSHILQFREIPTDLTLDRLSAEDKYLFEMRASWQNCEPFERTGGGPVHSITLHLRTAMGAKIDVSFPDVVGEEFEEQWRGREWSAEFTAAIASASALTLFINAGTLEKPMSKVDVANTETAILAAIGDQAEPGEVDTAASVASDGRLPQTMPSDTGEAIAREVASQSSDVVVAVSDPKIWNPRDADSQVKIVDILQAVASFNEEKYWKLAVIVSAWDVVKAQMRAITPPEWFKKACPFIWQYLDCNTPAFQYKVFGVSAQGGDPLEDAERLRAYDAQSERVELVYDDYDGHDLTRVLSWTMGI